MANIFATSSHVLGATRLAAAILNAQCVAAGLVNRDVEAQFRTLKTGGTVNVRYRPRLAATLDEDNKGQTTLSVTDNQQSTVPVDATNYVYVYQRIPSHESTFSLENFARDVIAPAMEGMKRTIDQFFIRRIAGGFARNLVGTAGTNPSTEAHIANGYKEYIDNEGPLNRGPLTSIIGSAAMTAYSQLDIFKSRDYGEANASALENARLGRKHNIDFYMDQNAGTFEQGDEAGTVLVNGGSQTGTTLNVDGFTAASGVIRQGTRITIASVSGTYTVTEDVDIASNAAALTITPALASSPADNAAITFETAFTQDVIFHPDAVAGAIVAPEPLMAPTSQVATFENISMRMTLESTTAGANGAADLVLFDAFIGCNVIRPEMGLVYQG